MEQKILKEIANAAAEEMDAILKAVIDRYSQLFPDWEITIVTIEKEKDINKQIDRMIHMLNKMKRPG